MLVSFVGMGVAFFMTTGPTPAQVAAAEATGEMPIVGAHSVGVEDGGQGLPIVGWSTAGGDLRASHFVGLHALQVLPLIGFLYRGLRPGLAAIGAPGGRWCGPLVWAHLGLVLLLTWQALRGQPVISPDLLTLGVLGPRSSALPGAFAIAVVLRARHAR